MNRAGLIVSLCLAAAGPAHATGDITCATGDGAVSVSLLVGRTDTLTVLRTVVAIGDETWSSDPAQQPGQPILAGQAFENGGMLLIDFTGEAAGPIIARLRAFTVSEADSYASGGVFALTGKGSWVVDCSERG